MYATDRPLEDARDPRLLLLRRPLDSRRARLPIFAPFLIAAVRSNLVLGTVRLHRLNYVVLPFQLGNAHCRRLQLHAFEFGPVKPWDVEPVVFLYFRSASRAASKALHRIFRQQAEN